MRCTRCDAIAAPPVLGRDPEGHLVFGWCARCLEETGCSRVEAEPVALKAPRPPLRRRVRHLRRRVRKGFAALRAFPWNSTAGRRLILLGLTMALSVWSALLALVGAYRLFWPASAFPSPTGNGSSALLLAGSASMGLMSVLLLTWLARPEQRVRVLISVVSAASGTSTLLSLALWLARPIPGPWSSLTAASSVTFGVSWFLGRRMRRARRKVAAPVARDTEDQTQL